MSDNEAFLRSGKLAASVPEPAHGFKVGTPEFIVVDYGTQFGCIVPALGVGEVHVFADAAQFQASDAAAAATGSQVQLREHQAVRLENRQLREIPANPDIFLTEEKLALRRHSMPKKSGAFTKKAAWASRDTISLLMAVMANDCHRA
jgi:hypothetical protein